MVCSKNRCRRRKSTLTKALSAKRRKNWDCKRVQFVKVAQAVPIGKVLTD
jgi:hypothetical protein